MGLSLGDRADEEHEPLPQPMADHNVYKLGTINGHNNVLGGLQQKGNCPATMAVTLMRTTFPNLKCGLLVGIGGGIPRTTSEGMIQLGHVVVSRSSGTHSGAVQYDHGRATTGSFERVGCLPPPPAVLPNAAQAPAVERVMLDEDLVTANLNRIQTSRRGLHQLQHPGMPKDNLYSAEYIHKHPGSSCDEAWLRSRCEDRKDD